MLVHLYLTLGVTYYITTLSRSFVRSLRLNKPDQPHGIEIEVSDDRYFLLPFSLSFLERCLRYVQTSPCRKSFTLSMKIRSYLLLVRFCLIYVSFSLGVVPFSNFLY